MRTEKRTVLLLAYRVHHHLVEIRRTGKLPLELIFGNLAGEIRLT